VLSLVSFHWLFTGTSIGFLASAVLAGNGVGTMRGVNILDGLGNDRLVVES
jgi:hypothetical protein